jgi:hypothetical protein
MIGARLRDRHIRSLISYVVVGTQSSLSRPHNYLFYTRNHTMTNQAGVGYMMYRHWLIGGMITWKDGDRERKRAGF